MTGPRHVSDVVAGIFGRGGLPAVVECRRAVGRVPAGAVLVWSDDESGYRLGDGVVLAGFVRAHLFNFSERAAAVGGAA